ncbi:MAG: 4Fe-4S dicluster domain-containing protein [Thermoanaerobacteraceae bacterium]|nr:4Fe-4S dicluster domain-containing protein [Thermoanaerobacteraceae bacterium]
MPRVVVKPEVCIGCHLCEIWCVVAHSRSKNILKAFLHERPRPVPRVVVEENLPATLPVHCRHCFEPSCVDACISGALYRDPLTGRVEHDGGRCVGCYSCVMACPYGAVAIDEVNRKVAKCDLCTELGEPACVKQCPNGALVYQDSLTS